MLAMLKKEFICSKLTIIISMIALSIFTIACSSFMTTSVTMPLSFMMALLVPIIIDRFSSTEEMRKNYDLVMNSFPVKRSDVVYAKFAYYILLFLMVFSVFTVLTLIFNKFKPMELHIFFLVESAVFMFYSIFMGFKTCLYFAFDKSIMMKYGSFITLSVIYVPILLISLINKFFPNVTLRAKSLLTNVYFVNNATIILIIFSLILYSIFMSIGIMGYNKKDFY